MRTAQRIKTTNYRNHQKIYGKIRHNKHVFISWVFYIRYMVSLIQSRTDNETSEYRLTELSVNEILLSFPASIPLFVLDYT